MKNRRYRRGNVADEVPSTILLDNDDQEEEEEQQEIEEPGEIIGEESRVQPHNYSTINEEEILSKSKSILLARTSFALNFFLEKFKRPADDEDIYEPNRPKKSTKVKVRSLFNRFLSHSFL